MSEKSFTRLKDLVDGTFTVQKVWGFRWKMWIPEENRMHTSDTYVEGHSKKWQLETDKGELDVSDYQFGNMLASVFEKGESKPIGRTFSVKSNGKEGKEIRYWINPVRQKKAEEPEAEVVLQEVDEGEPINYGDIPF